MKLGGGEMKEPFGEIDDISNYAIRLKSKWRSLLDDDSTDRDRQRRSESSYLFRPRGTVGLDPTLDPATFVRKAGDQLDDFELLRLVGQGGMGQVWEANQLSLNRRVALKLIRPDLVTPEVLAFFGREGRAAGRLHHPCIVSTHAMGESEGVHWIAQEFIDGECTLASFLDAIDPNVPLPRDYDRRMAFFFYQLADALHYAHGANIIHRDLKPQNILITDGDRPKIADFGLALIEDEASLSREGALHGTPRYMSPEQALGNTVKIDRRSDVFSLGAMLYKVLTLEFPFKGDSLPTLLHAVVKEEPIPLTRIRPELSSDLAAIVMRALEKRPSARYASMAEFADDLACYLDGRSTQARPIGGVQRAAKWVRRNPWPSVIAATVLVATLLIASLVGALGTSQQQTNFAEWEQQLLKGRAAIEEGDYETANAALAIADQLRPSEPVAPLLLAGAAMRRSRYRQAEAFIEEARVRGYDPVKASEDNAEEQLQLGLYYFANGRLPAYPQAERALLTALELDPSLKSAWFPIYQIRKALDDYEGARAALLEFRKDLVFGDPLFRRVEALALECEGEYGAARDVLLDLASDSEIQPESLRQLRVSGDLGRAHMFAGEFELASEQLQLAVKEDPEDFDSWNNLASSYLGQFVQEGRQGSEDLSLLERTKTAAATALGLCTDQRSPLRTLALVEHYRGVGTSTRGDSALLNLRKFDSEDRVLRVLEALIPYELGMDAWRGARYQEATEQFKACLRLDPANFIARLLVAQDDHFLGTTEGWTNALAHLDIALQAWRDRNVLTQNRILILRPTQGIDYPSWVQVMLVTRFTAAARLDLVDVAEEAIQLLESELKNHTFVDFEEQLTYAEALVLSENPRLRDPARARSLLEDYFERSGTDTSGGWPPSYDETIRTIQKGIDG